MAINTNAVNEVVDTIAESGSLAVAIDSLSTGDTNTLATLAAVNTLASQVVPGKVAKFQFGTNGIVLSVAGVAQEVNGEFNLNDVAALAALIGAGLARHPSPQAQAWAAYFNALAIAPTFGAYLGQNLWQPSEIEEKVNDWWERALNWIPRGDPLTLDLDGDGIETIGADGSVVFDHNGDGVKTGTGCKKRGRIYF